MSEQSPVSQQEETEHPAPSKMGRLRWQFILLGVGLVLIAGAVLFFVLHRSGDERAAPPRFEFSETQTYVEAVVGKPMLVNPLLAVSQADRDLVALIFSGLVRVDEFGQPVPDLAESWDVSEDGLIYTFRLRSGVQWHDGAPFTAEDVAFTMSLLRDPNFPGPADLGAFWRTVETYIVDDATVRFVLTQPLSAFPEYAGIGILPAHLLGGINPADLPSDPFNLAPIGTGRLRWVSSEQEGGATVVHLEPHTAFYDPARRVQLSAVDLRFYPDANLAFRALGPDAQALGGLTPSQLEAAFASPELNIYTARLPIYAAIIFNQQAPTRLPFFQDEAVRVALAAALDRQALVEDFLSRQALLADSTVLPGTWAFNPLVTPTPYDVTAAAQALDEAGWTLSGNVRSKDSTPLAFTLLVTDRASDRQLGQAIVEQWRALGVNVTLQTLSAADLLERLQTPAPGGEGRNFDAALVEFSQGRLADPDPYPFWHEAQAEQGQNYSGFADRDISEALEIARRDPNGVRRAELYRSYQQWFWERGAAILLYNPVYHYAVSCQVQGVQLQILVDPSDRFRNLHEWYIVQPDQLDQVCP